MREHFHHAGEDGWVRTAMPLPDGIDPATGFPFGEDQVPTYRQNRFQSLITADQAERLIASEKGYLLGTLGRAEIARAVRHDLDIGYAVTWRDRQGILWTAKQTEWRGAVSITRPIPTPIDQTPYWTDCADPRCDRCPTSSDEVSE